MDVSIVVPTRNRGALLARTLRSALRQRAVQVEIIVVDEASTDETPAVLAAMGDRRVRVVRHERPLGVSTARNRGAAEARGDWVAFLDDDDLWAPDKIAAQIEAARCANRDWAYAGAVNVTPRHSDHASPVLEIVCAQPILPPEEVVFALRRYNAIPGGGSNVVVRRAALLQAGPFDVRLRNTEDWEMWLRLAAAGPPAWVCRPLIAYRLHPSNSSLDVAEILRGVRLIEALHGTLTDRGTLHRWLAESYLRRGERRAALGQFARAALHNEAGGVARDLAAIAGRRLRRIRARRPVVATAPTPWIQEAAAWLSDFEKDVL